MNFGPDEVPDFKWPWTSKNGLMVRIWWDLLGAYWVVGPLFCARFEVWAFGPLPLCPSFAGV